MALIALMRLLLRPRLWLVAIIILNFRSLPFAHSIKFFVHIVKAHLDFHRRRAIQAPRPTDIWATRIVTHRVMCDDMDFNIHMTNSSYNKLLDHCRADHVVGVFGAHNAKGRRFANGGVQMWFRREIKPFQRFEVRTRLLAYDSKWFFVEHRFVVPRAGAGNGGDVLCAVGVSKQVVKRAGGRTVPFEEFVASCGFGVEEGSGDAEVRERRRERGWSVVEGLFDVEAGLLELAHSAHDDELQMETF